MPDIMINIRGLERVRDTMGLKKKLKDCKREENNLARIRGIRNLKVI